MTRTRIATQIAAIRNMYGVWVGHFSLTNGVSHV
jgi:hypothetical protein